MDTFLNDSDIELLVGQLSDGDLWSKAFAMVENLMFINMKFDRNSLEQLVLKELLKCRSTANNINDGHFKPYNSDSFPQLPMYRSDIELFPEWILNSYSIFLEYINCRPWTIPCNLCLSFGYWTLNSIPEESLLFMPYKAYLEKEQTAALTHSAFISELLLEESIAGVIYEQEQVILTQLANLPLLNRTNLQEIKNLFLLVERNGLMSEQDLLFAYRCTISPELAQFAHGESWLDIHETMANCFMDSIYSYSETTLSVEAPETVLVPDSLSESLELSATKELPQSQVRPFQLTSPSLKPPTLSHTGEKCKQHLKESPRSPRCSKHHKHNHKYRSRLNHRSRYHLFYL